MVLVVLVDKVLAWQLVMLEQLVVQAALVELVLLDLQELLAAQAELVELVVWDYLFRT